MNRNLTILIIEDSEPDRFFLKRAFKKCEFSNPLQEATSAVEALNYLGGSERFSDRTKYPFPSLIISNLRIGLEVLKWVRAHPEHFVIPVLFLQDSTTDENLKAAYRLGANACLSRPSSPKELEKLLLVTADFWSRCDKPAMPNSL